MRTRFKSPLLWIGSFIFLIAIGVSAYVAFTWLDWNMLRYARFETTLPVYPGTENLGRDFAFTDGQSGVNAVYFWSSDSLDKVKSFYQALSQQPQNALVRFILRDRSARRCFKWPASSPNCVEITLTSFPQGEMVSLPGVASMPGAATPTPKVISRLRGGTVIQYCYYTRE